MNKNELLTDFLKGFRIVLNNAAAYPKDHPYFVKSVESFKQRINPLFTMVNPLRINIGPDFLLIGDKKWEKEAFFTELAQMLHLRKIKSIQLAQDISLAELVDLLSGIAMPPKELLRSGGVGAILKNADTAHVYVEEVDYSQLLGIEGEESKDVWVYLFGDIVNKENRQKIDEFADNFEKIMRKFRPQDLLDDEDLKKNLHNFLVYLKDYQKDKFQRCAGELFRSAIGSKDITEIDNIEKVKSLFHDFNEEDFAGMLWDGVYGDNNFDILSLQLFCRLTGQDRHKKIASLFLDKAKEKPHIQDDPKMVKKIQGLLSGSSDKVVSEVYRSTLSILLKEISLTPGMSFDRALLAVNYRYVLLNLFEMGLDGASLSSVVQKLTKELEGVAKEKDLGYLKALLGVLRRREQEKAVSPDTLTALEIQISKFIEAIIWEEYPPAELEYFTDSLKHSSLKAEAYLDRIFLDNKINSYALKLFFGFFPQAVPLFLKRLEEKYPDMDFLSRLIDGFAAANRAFSLQILKHIATVSNEFIKIQALRAMRRISDFDPEYLLSILETASAPLRKEALLVLSRSDKARQLAIERLLGVRSPWGSKNELILENMSIIHEVKVREAHDYFVALSKRHFLWNMNVRREARKILKEWDVR